MICKSLCAMRRAQGLSYTAKGAAKERQKFFRSPKLLVAGLFLARQGDVVNARHHVHVDGPDDEDFRSFFLAYRHESHLVSPRL